MTKLILIALIATFGVATTASAADVHTNWKKHCLKCHGPNGRGDTKMGKKLDIPDLTDPAVHEKYTEEEMFARVKNGVKDKHGKTRMAPAETLKDKEIRALIRYVRALPNSK